jgi:hypothetical protein
MAQVSIGQVENLEDLARGLESVREALESACREQIAAAEGKCAEVQDETENSKRMLESACQAEQEMEQASEDAQQDLESTKDALSAAKSALSSCKAEPPDKDGNRPSCSGEEGGVKGAQGAVKGAQEAVEKTQTACEKAKENHQQMEQRVEFAMQALAMAEQVVEQAQAECEGRLAAVSQSIDVATRRLSAAQQALNAYLATNPPAAQFHSWLHWNPAQHSAPVTPDTLRDRMNLSTEQLRLFQDYLYDRNPNYRNLIDKYRDQWATAKCDVERNMVSHKTTRGMAGNFGEQLARHALAPLGGKIETQSRTVVGDGGKYTKTDLLITGLRVPVIFGRGTNMWAPVGGALACELKCGKPDYLYKEKDHMVFQAAGHKQADARCTLVSRDIHDLPPEKEKDLRNTLREAGSPIVGMMPYKNEIDKSCLEFIHQAGKE